MTEGERYILYTPLAPEDIWPTDPPVSLESCQTRMVSGRLCLIRVDTRGVPRLERLLSTDPQDYLDTRWQPGQPIW